MCFTVCISVPSAIAGHMFFNRSGLALQWSGCMFLCGGYGPRVWLQVQWAGCEKSRWCQNSIMAEVCLLLSSPFWDNSLISIFYVLSSVPSFCRGARYFYPWSICERMWKVDSKNPRVFLVMQSANSGWWFITSWESVHNWEHKQSQRILLSWVLWPCLFHTVFIWKKIALLSFSNFLTFYTHFAPILCQDEWDSQG